MSEKPKPGEIERALYRTRDARLYSGETQLVKSIQAYLRTVVGVACFRRNVGIAEYTSNEAGKRRVVRFGIAGQADLWFLHPTGLHGEIEAKQPGLKPTPQQLEWLQFMREHGAIAIWCSSLEELAGQLAAEYGRRGLHWEPSWRIR